MGGKTLGIGNRPAGGVGVELVVPAIDVCEGKSVLVAVSGVIVVVDEHTDFCIEEVKGVVVVGEEFKVIPAEEGAHCVNSPSIVVANEDEVSVRLSRVGLKEEEVNLSAVIRNGIVSLSERVKVEDIRTNDGSKPSVFLVDVA